MPSKRDSKGYRLQIAFKTGIVPKNLKKKLEEQLQDDCLSRFFPIMYTFGWQLIFRRSNFLTSCIGYNEHQFKKSYLMIQT